MAVRKVPETTAEHRRIAAIYQALMQEVRDRFHWLHHALNAKMGVPQALLEEFTYLQIRLICEVIAIGCIVAHGDIPATRAKRVLKRWSAAEMLAELERLTPDAFPIPFVQKRTVHLVDGEEVEGWHFEERPPDFLSKEELLKLYARCGDRLHRGSPKNILANRPYPTTELSELAAFVQKLIYLTAIHRVSLLGGDAQLLCILYPDDSEEVRVLFGYANDSNLSLGTP